jgi:hypothetical protein
MPLYGPASAVQENYTASTAPTVTDDVTKGYVIGSQWVDTVSGYTYVCVNNTTGAAVWNQNGITQPGSSAAGAKGNIQFRGNNTGTFDAVSSLTWDTNASSLQIGVTPSAFANALQTSALNTNSFAQAVVQNLSSGTQATSDLVATSNLGTDLTYFVDLGINSSGYNDPAYPLSVANDSYLYCESGNLTVGTDTPGKYLLFHTGSYALTAERMRFVDAVAAKDAYCKLSTHLQLLNDTTANRPTTPLNGMVRYNSSTNKFEGYENSAWINLVIPTPVSINNGGTGQTTQPTAVNALLPSQSGQSGLYLKTNGTDVSWATAGSGTADNDTQTVNASNAISTTSTTAVDMANMTLTTSNTSTKQYLILFTCTWAQAKQSTLSSFALVVDGSTVTTRTLVSAGAGTTTTAPQGCVIQWTVSLATAKVIKVQYYTGAGQGTEVHVSNRNLSIRGL